MSATRPGLEKIQLMSAEIILSPRHPGESSKDSTHVGRKYSKSQTPARPSLVKIQLISVEIILSPRHPPARPSLVKIQLARVKILSKFKFRHTGLEKIHNCNRNFQTANDLSS